MAYNNIVKTDHFDTTCLEWRNTPPAEKSWDLFKTHFKTAGKDLCFLVTTGSSGYHGAAHMVTNADNRLLAAIQVKLAAAEDALDVTLVHHTITPTASVSNAASNVSVMIPATDAPSVSNACSYCWTHGITINM
jgi:hypothetical protein